MDNGEIVYKDYFNAAITVSSDGITPHTAEIFSPPPPFVAAHTAVAHSTARPPPRAGAHAGLPLFYFIYYHKTTTATTARESTAFSKQSFMTGDRRSGLPYGRAGGDHRLRGGRGSPGLLADRR